MLTALGHYRVICPLGSGGTAQVYLADDTRLHRKVALKVLPPAAVADPDRRRRFEREAQVVAALNHPGIVTIYSIEETEGWPFLTMEYVPGTPLADLIPRGGLELDRLLDIAVPLVDAVAAAHSEGVVHRDLKPANVIVMENGRVKVLDFGLALLTDVATATLTDASATDAVRPGGTVAYMSPEQAEGKPVDHRTDIFALGIVLYELACGERPFQGESVFGVLSAIITTTPRSLSDIKPTSSPALTAIVQRCLAKDPERRFHSAKDLRNELQELQASVRAPDRQPVRSRTRPRWWVPSLLAAAALAILVWAARDAMRRARPAEAVRVDTTLTLRSARELPVSTTDFFTSNHVSLSRDGQWVVYSGGLENKQDIFLRSIHGERALNLTADSGTNNWAPAFSPDGERIAFRSRRDGGGVFVMGRTGESVTRLTDFGFSPAWSPDGKRIAIAGIGADDDPRRAPVQNSPLWLVDVATGERLRLPVEDGLEPAWSPDGRFIAYWGRDQLDHARQIFVIHADGTGRARIVDGNGGEFFPTWSPDGAYLYFLSDRSGRFNLWRVAFDGTTGRSRGQPEPYTLPSPFVAGVSLSAAGRIAWISYDQNTTTLKSLTIDPRGRESHRPPSTLLTTPTMFWDLDLSPDGAWLLLGELNDGQFFICRTDGTGLRRLTMPGRFREPHWFGDGHRIAFFPEDLSDWSLWSIATDGSNLRKIHLPVAPGSPALSVDGSRMAVLDPSGTVSVLRTDSETATVSATLPAMPGKKTTFMPAAWSPDGTQLAGHISAGGVAVYSFGTRSYQHVADEGVLPTWFEDGKRLLFTVWNPPKLVVLDLRTHARSELFEAGPEDVISGARPTRDGQRVYFVHSRVPVTIWTAELK